MTFQERLQRVMRGGNLTVADLARLFERPHATVRGWVNGTGIGGGHLDREAVYDLLDQIEVRISKKRGLPVPRMSPREKIKYLATMRA